MKFIIFMVALVAQLSAHATVGENTQEKNKRIVTEFYNMAFNEHQPVAAANKYLAESYIQHNPHVADGRKGFIEAFSGDTGSDTSTTEFKRFISENDLVVVHSHGKQNPQDRGVAVVDIFRVDGDLITEHWDVGQKVPETSKNNNTMF
ncbi:MAG: nuclear transport factor 2 family protein [Bdellovibrionaceae bacterium]|nr:nuclear transport factor 2 family protein [Pseudobdellovibrionaceae bacterium]